MPAIKLQNAPFTTCLISKQAILNIQLFLSDCHNLDKGRYLLNVFGLEVKSGIKAFEIVTR